MRTDGTMLEGARLHLGLSKGAMAAELGINAATLYRMSTGKLDITEAVSLHCRRMVQLAELGAFRRMNPPDEPPAKAPRGRRAQATSADACTASSAAA